MTKDVNPWELIHDKAISQLVFAYEMVLTEMRTHGRANKTIREWVERLDSERDEFAVAMSTRGAPPNKPPPHRYDLHTIISPSAVCGLIGCTNQQVHVHDVREPA